MTESKTKKLPIPEFFDPNKVSQIWRVPYQQRATEAHLWAKKYKIPPAAEDKIQTCLLLIDVQNTFCLPEFELFVAGKSGNGAVEDNIRLCEFIYQNFDQITAIYATQDTHTAQQIFHPFFWINAAGENPPPMTNISLEDVKNGIWKVNPSVADSLEIDAAALQKYALHYVKELDKNSKYNLTIWPYHGILGGVGHALVSSVEEALFFHNIARKSQTHFEQKGSNPLTENYSVLQPEVLEDAEGKAIAQPNTSFLEKLLSFDRLIIAGQAKSHCVAWTVSDLLTEIKKRDPNLAKKVYLLEDCTSPVVIKNVVDFSQQADAAFQQFAASGMHIVKSLVFNCEHLSRKTIIQ